VWVGSRRVAGRGLHRGGVRRGQRGSVAGHLLRGVGRPPFQSGRPAARSPGAAGCAAFASGAGRGCTRGSSAAVRGQLPPGSSASPRAGRRRAAPPAHRVRGPGAVPSRQSHSVALGAA
jgi:hypothetical protein